MLYMTSETSSRPDEVPDMYCFWKDFKERYDPKYVQAKHCDSCTGMEAKCPLYMPLSEMEEIMGRN